jgi:hypothetical protein
MADMDTVMVMELHMAVILSTKEKKLPAKK